MLALQFEALIETLRDRHRSVLEGGGAALVERHRSRGKIPVRDRIDLLLDAASPFLELSPLAANGLYDGELPSAGIVTGIGLVHDTPCMVIANDATVKGGSFFAETVRKHLRAQEIAEQHRLPCVYLVDCGGAFLPEQDRVFPDRDHFGGTFYNQCRMSAAGIPQISAVFGGCTAGGAYIPALSDQVVMVRGTGRIHLGGPPIVKAAINEIVDGETLGGADMHATVSGVTDHVADTETEAIGRLREIILGFGPLRRVARPPFPPVAPAEDPEQLTSLVPVDLKKPYDVHDVITRIVDGSDFQEFKPSYGSSLVTAFARIHGFPVGILANNGVLFSEFSGQGRPFHRIVRPASYPASVPAEHHGIHGWNGSGARRHREAFGQARVCGFQCPCSEIHRVDRGIVRCGQLRHVRPRVQAALPVFLAKLPHRDHEFRTSQRRSSPNFAARVSKGAAGQAALAELDQRTRAQFEQQSDPYYATARLWDDGIIEPAQTRDVLGLCLALSADEPRDTSSRPVYRM